MSQLLKARAGLFTPKEMGEHVVMHYDDNENQVQTTPIIFASRSAALDYINNNVDPKLDAFPARRA